MRDLREGICELCDGREVIVSTPIEYTGDNTNFWGAHTVAHRWRNTWYAGEQPDPAQRFGQLMLYVCRACGYAQWFAYRPEDIPIGDEYHTRLVQGPPKGVYR
ncbi:MAG: hypothetical protein WKG00_07020 [Polyangiaceae bacterium]